MKPYLSVIIPAYNEEKRIGTTLDAIYNYLTAQPFSWEILVVLDGGTDNTLGIVKTFAHNKERIRWIDRQENRGKGFTVRQGMLDAQGEIRLFTDADNSTDMSHFDKMRPYFNDGRQVVICSRDAKDHPDATQVVPQPFFKRLLGDMGNLLIQLLAVPGIWDTQCGYKAFTAEAAEKIFSVARIERYAIDIEALALARKFRYKIAIVGAHWIDNADTHVRMRDYLNTFWEAFKVRWNLMIGAYNKKPSLPAASTGIQDRV